MDGEVTEETESISPSRKLSFGEYFKEWFPFYFNCGMTYDQYWKEDSSLVIMYFHAYTLRRDEQNYFAWLHGFYNYYGYSTALANFGAGLGGKRGGHDYMHEPAQIRPKTEEEIEADKVEKRRKFVAALNRFHARMGAKQNAERKCD